MTTSTISSGESDERAAFEAWAKAYGRIFLNRLASGLYAYAFTQEAWVGWKARAALATQPAPVEPAPCKRCGGTRVVDDGEIDCYPDGSPYLNGPVKCVKDCPVCTPNGRPVGAESKACASVGVEPITVEAVATVVRGDDGELRLSWLIEGSLSAMVEGEVLMISGGANLTDDEGRGEVYLAPFTPPAVEESPNEARRQALAFGEYLKDCDKHAIQTDTAGAFLWAWRAALASPAPLTDPLQGAADWLKKGLVDVTVADIQSRLLIGYNRARRLFDGATPPAAPAATEAPSTVTEAVEYAKRTLERIALSIGTSTTAENERSWRSAADMAIRGIEWALAHTPAPAVGASPDVFFPCVDDKDNERLNRIEALMNTTFDGKEVPQVWFKRADVLRIVSAAVGASVQPAAGALPPVRWWSGVVGSPEKLANLLDEYSEKKESPRRDERVMRAAAKWIREVGASVQPVLASLSDEQDAARYRWLRERPLDWSVEHHRNGWSTCYGRGELDAAIDAARGLASSTPAKGGEAS